MINRTTPPPIHSFSTLAMPPESVDILSNGITLHTLSGGDQPTCRMSIYFEGGISEFNNDITGRFVLTALTDGTKDMSPDEVADILDYNGVRLSAGNHGHYSSLRLALLNHRINDVLPIIGKLIANPLFPADRIETARIKEKVRLKSDAEVLSNIANRAFSEMIMGKEHPMAKTDTGTDVDKHTVEYVHAIHNQMICPSKIHVFLAGMLDSYVIDSVKSFLNNIPSLGNGFNSAVIPFTSAPAATIKTIDKNDSYQSCVMCGIPTITREHEHYIPLRLATLALGGYFGSRLMRNIREEKGLTYGISAMLVGSQEGSYFKVIANCDKKYTETVLNEISRELEKLKLDPPQGKELERLKLSAFTTLAEILDTPYSILGYYTSQLLVGTPDHYFQQQQKTIETLTPDLISEMASKYLNPSQLRIAIAGA